MKNAFCVVNKNTHMLRFDSFNVPDLSLNSLLLKYVDVWLSKRTAKTIKHYLLNKPTNRKLPCSNPCFLAKRSRRAFNFQKLN